MPSEAAPSRKGARLVPASASGRLEEIAEANNLQAVEEGETDLTVRELADAAVRRAK